MEVFEGLHIFVVPSMYTLDHVWADVNGTSYSRTVNINNINSEHSPNSFLIETD